MSNDSKEDHIETKKVGDCSVQYNMFTPATILSSMQLKSCRFGVDKSMQKSLSEKNTNVEKTSLKSFISVDVNKLKRKLDDQSIDDNYTDTFESKSLNTGGKKREEKNQREKARSSKIAMQISDLHELLTIGGVKSSKGTKSSVLSEAAGYIRRLQQREALSET